MSKQQIRAQLLAHLKERDERAAFLANTSKLLHARRTSVADTQVATVEPASDRLTFMKSLSHSIRTPLHSIYGSAEILVAGVHGQLTGPQRDDVHRIQANERHLLTLVDAVISFAKWEDTESVALEDVNVRAAVVLTNPTVTGAAALKGVIYDSDSSIATDLVVRAEPIRLNEILLQLMTNGVRYSMPSDTISVAAVAVGQRIWIRVTDTGIGIAEKDMELVFQPFVRAQNAYARSQPGVGLGLAIARRLAREMGGDVTVVSKQGRGSTFTLSLPRGRVERDRPAPRIVHADESLAEPVESPTNRRSATRRRVDKRSAPDYGDRAPTVPV